ncbi:MAG: hypothetical protein QXY49_01835 [Thermofilaceae archaeon]
MEQRVWIGTFVLILVIVIIFSLAQIACYEVRLCNGGLTLYVNYALLAIFGLFVLSLTYVLTTKFLHRHDTRY